LRHTDHQQLATHFLDLWTWKCLLPTL
jgi:hypothetical protein